MMPATFASASMRPPAAATTAATVSSVEMSPATGTRSSPAFSATRSSRRSLLMSAAMTRPPSLAMRSAVAWPMPEAAPVTMTVLPANRPVVVASCHEASLPMMSFQTLLTVMRPSL